jgi:GT2 family glycosyltransferase
MIQVSVIIVNYNVRYFIEQAIVSVKKAAKHLQIEIIVVDNNSSDTSVEMIKHKFPDVQLIVNKENVGFGRANNQGIQIAKGEYILLLNPDTVLQENTLETCINFIEKTSGCGALGVKMIDGKGNFLPESKRALPTPKVAFYKMSGLAALFPRSRTFGQYHLGYLDKNENHEVEVLSGAFMFFRGELLHQIGGFDEDYFMYGEDIDLSFQVIKQGYKNYYIADTSIIHYKGESTKKGSLNYVKVFYEAMLIFAKKHFTKKQAKIYGIAIYIAIFFRGGIALVSNLTKALALPVIDGLLSFSGVFLLTKFWALEIKQNPDYYPFNFLAIILPLYALVWILANVLSGSYEKPFKTNKVWKGIFFGTISILAIYGLLPEELRFSRAVILLGALTSGGLMLLSRLVYNVFKHSKFAFELNEHKRVVIVGNKEESSRALNLLKDSAINIELAGFVSVNEENSSENCLGEFKSIADIVSLYQIEEIIFCGKDISAIEIIATMSEIGNSLNYKILPEESVSIIGSNSKNSAGDLYAIDVNLKIASNKSRWLKRSFDILTCCFLVFSLPANIFFVNQKLQYVRNIIKVLSGKLSWVGYYKYETQVHEMKLPSIRNGVLSPMDTYKNTEGLTGKKLNLLYAKNYAIEIDTTIILKGFPFLGNLTN